MTGLLDAPAPSQDDAPAAAPEAPAPRRRGRPPTRPSSAQPSDALRAHAMKRYDLRDDERQTAGHLRRILAQRHIPDLATVVIGEASLIFEWDE